MPGAGGLEASMFAEEIFNLYLAYVGGLGFSAEVTELSRSVVGKQSKFSSSTGITKGSAVISGVNVFGQLKFESGVHRLVLVFYSKIPRKLGYHSALSARLQTQELQEFFIKINFCVFRIFYILFQKNIMVPWHFTLKFSS